MLFERYFSFQTSNFYFCQELIEFYIEVQCISAEGLRKLSASNPIRKFRDPLRREGDRMLTIKEDYESYVLRGIVASFSISYHANISGEMTKNVYECIQAIF